MTVARVQTRESLGPRRGHGCEEGAENTGLGAGRLVLIQTLSITSLNDFLQNMYPAL